MLYEYVISSILSRHDEKLKNDILDTLILVLLCLYKSLRMHNIALTCSLPKPGIAQAKTMFQRIAQLILYITCHAS